MRTREKGNLLDGLVYEWCET